MTELMDRNRSGKYGESHVFYQLSKKGFLPQFAVENQEGYDLEIRSGKKIEVKHIQRIGESSNDSFILKKSQARQNSFDYLILLVSDNQTENINHKYYVFTWDKINEITNNKETGSGNYTFNLSKDGNHLAGLKLSGYHDKWSTIAL